MVLTDVTNKDMEATLGWFEKLIVAIGDGIMAVVNFLPDVVLGGIVVVLIILAIYHHIKN